MYSILLQSNVVPDSTVDPIVLLACLVLFVAFAYFLIAK